MTCKHCIHLFECLTKSKSDENFAGIMYNMCFWENSDRRCPDFTLNPDGEVKEIPHL